MYVCRFIRLLETHKCASVACVLLSFFDSISLASYTKAHSATQAFDVRQQITKWEQLPLRLDCVFKFMNVLRRMKLNMSLDDPQRFSNGARSGELEGQSRP